MRWSQGQGSTQLKDSIEEKMEKSHFILQVCTHWPNEGMT